MTAQFNYSVSPSMLRGMLECAARCGVPVSQIEGVANNVGGAHASAHQGEQRYPGDVSFRLWERFVKLSGDPIIGFRMAQASDLSTFGLIGQMVPRCPSVLDSCLLLERYLETLSSATPVKVSTDSTTFTLTTDFTVPEGPIRTTGLLWVLTNFSKIPSLVAGADARPLLVECTAFQLDAAAMHTVTQALPIKFNRSHNRVTFDASVGRIQNPTADETLIAYLLELAEHKLAELGSEKRFEASLKSILRHMINGEIPTIQDLCRKTGMSQRTLQRRLSKEGTTFHELLQIVLREAADNMLARPDVTQAEIAFHLGYSEESAFSRAYRSWTGVSPGEFRARSQSQSSLPTSTQPDPLKRPSTR